MFNIDIKHNKKVLIESSSIHGFIMENSISMIQNLLKYKNIITNALNESSGVYDDSVKNAMEEATKYTFNDTIKIYEAFIDILKNFKEILQNEYEHVVSVNRKVAETYEPLIKQLDTSRVSYEIPSYTLNNLKLSDMVTRLIDTIKNKFKADINGNYESFEKVIHCYMNDSDKYVTEIKRAILGVPPTVNVNGDFFALVRDQLIKPNVYETKQFSSEIFECLKKPDYIFSDIDDVIFILENEIAKVRDKIQSIYVNMEDKSNNNNYYNNLYSNVVAIQSILFGLGMSYIEDILKYKLKLFNEKFVNYRRVVINTYNKLTGKSTQEVTNESYKPHKDETIGSLYIECALSNI